MEMSDEIALLEARLNDLKVAYDKYFAGVEKLEPLKLRNDVQKMVRRVGTFHITNSGLKFKRDTVIAHFNTYTQYWNRILKQIEDGTYQRDLFRMRLKDRQRGSTPPPPPAGRDQAPQAGSPAQTPGAPPTEKAIGTAPAGGKPGAAPSKPAPPGEFDGVFKSLVAAKKRLGEPTENISYNALEWSLKKEAEAIKKKFKATRVDFTVEVKDGKTVIKAVPIK